MNRLEPGESVSCTFVNVEDPPTDTITIIKAALPEDDTPFDFTDTIKAPNSFILTDPSDTTKTFTGVTSGQYTVIETAGPGWTLTGVRCTDFNSTGDANTATATINLEPGETVSCTFVNVKDPSGGFCPANDPNVGLLMTDLLGTGQGSTTKGARTRKLAVPNYQDVASLYGQLAAVDVGVMKYVRFLYPNGQKIQIYDETSLAYRMYAVSWWGSKLEPNKFIKGQFFWGKKANKSPRAFVLWPTYNTTEEYANVLTLFDESSENHVYWEVGNGWINEQVQTIAIPETQTAGADILVKVALVDNNSDGRPVILTVEANGIILHSITYGPDAKDTLNLEEFLLENVPAGTNEVVITLLSPDLGGEFSAGGDSVAMIGAAASYPCETPVNP